MLARLRTSGRERSRRLAIGAADPPAYVKPYVKRQKNDATEAEAISETVTRPNMRIVTVKTEDQQAVLVLHRPRDLLMRHRMMILNAIWAHLAEFRVVAARGHGRLSTTPDA